MITPPFLYQIFTVVLMEKFQFVFSMWNSVLEARLRLWECDKRYTVVSG